MTILVGDTHVICPVCERTVRLDGEWNVVRHILNDHPLSQAAIAIVCALDESQDRR